MDANAKVSCINNYCILYYIVLLVILLYCRIIPWKSWEEWIQVKNCLFNENPDISSMVWALEIITLWKSRGKIPHSVESTAQLYEVIINIFYYSLTHYTITLIYFIPFSTFHTV